MIKWVLNRTKLLKDVTARDIPPGYSAYNIAIDCAPGYKEPKAKKRRKKKNG